jgi:hypothetical protein
MMENPMSKEANALLLNLLASGINAAGVHWSRAPEPAPEDKPRKGYDEPDDDDKDKDKDKGGTKISFL